MPSKTKKKHLLGHIFRPVSKVIFAIIPLAGIILGVSFFIVSPRFHSVNIVKASSDTSTSYNLGVVVIKYFPLTTNGQNIDIAVTGDVGEPYTTVRQRTITATDNLLIALPNATKYVGYADASALSSLNYQVVSTQEHTQAVPMLSDGTKRPNYFQILSDHNICNFVDNQNVREVWLWAYQGPGPSLNISESKMSGPFGDISNSYRENNMPLCQHTYRVYTFNYGRGTAEAFHSWGHQIEAELRAVDENLFTLFQGPAHPQTDGVTGRCGSVHNPPNSRQEYDYANTTPQNSDCLNWKPDAIGTTSAISCQNWGCLDLNDGNNSQLNYFVWMWQNLPGRDNAKTYQGKPLRNWWDVHGNFDIVMGSDKTLQIFQAPPGPANPITITDTFDRPNDSASMGTTLTGQPWIATRGIWGINNNQAYSVDGCPAPGFAVVESGTSDGDIQIAIPVNKQDARVIFRYVDTNNFDWLEHVGGDVYILKKMINGVQSDIAQVVGVIAANNDIIRISLKGAAIKIYVNSVLKTTTSDYSLFGTKHGLGNWCSSTIRFDNYSIIYVPPTPPPTPVTITLSPTADSYVYKSAPNKNYGKQSTVTVLGSGSVATKIAYLTFDLGITAGKTVTVAKLRLRTTSSSKATQTIYNVLSTTWTETGLNYNNRPTMSSLLTTFSAGRSGNWKEIDLTTWAQTRAGTISSLGIDQKSSDGYSFSSRESSNKPQLVVTYE